MKSKNTGRAREHRGEIYGLLYLAVAVFILLCLLSYDAIDPSLTTLAVGRKVHNLGGVIGAYLSDILFNLIGYGAYLVPVACLAASFLHFARKTLPDPSSARPRWVRTVSYFGLILFFTIFSHLNFREVPLGGRAIDAGGIVGWWLGGLASRFLGLTGAYLVATVGFLLSALSITQISLVRLGRLLQNLALFGLQKGKEFLGRFSVIAWARGKKMAAEFLNRLRERLQKKKKEKEREKAPIVRIAPPLRMEARPPAAAPAPIEKKILPVEAAVGNEPKILPRLDLKDMKENKKKDQLELISPVIADYQLPQLSFLDSESQDNVKIDEENLKLNSKLLEKKLMDYGVEGKITEIHPGPIITMYEFEPAAGVKVNKIVNLEDDLSLTMGGKSVRIIAPLPGKAAVGIEIPNNVRETVWLKEIIGHSKFQKADSKLTLALGKDTEGIPYVTDLAKMPHLLVAGATGSGKSVAVNSMILSILYKGTPDDVRMVLIDLKMLELSIYDKIPHLLMPVVTNPKRASVALRWAVSEMERRYELLSQKGVRNIISYNKAIPKEEKMPYIMLVIDELADLMMTAAKDVEVSITRLAQMARACGIHLILATQRPSVDVLTGLIKANFPARISFKVTSKHDSRTILDTVGSEHLLGNGDMLFMSGGTSGLLRIHGAYVSETEIVRVVEHWKHQGEPKYLDESVLKPLIDEQEKAAGGGSNEDFSDELYDQAVTIVSETRQASISMIQRRLRIGYNRAARMIERMEKEGVVGPADGAKAREVLVSNFGTGEA
jgi:S-DNA-T family DNA segregation ATPase FtsK/SpoIIIE